MISRYSKIILPSMVLFLIFCISACSKTAVSTNTTTQSTILCKNKTIEDTAEDLARCLPHIPSAQEQLRQWQRIAPSQDGSHRWGSVTSIDLLPEHGVELVITYHKNLDEVTWSPQGMIAILQQQGDEWHVVFESPAPSDVINEPNTLEGNWGYHILAYDDVTGDGQEDLIFDQSFYNGGRSSFGHTKVLTVDKVNNVKIIYLEDNGGFTSSDRYAIEDGKIHIDLGAIQQWHVYDPITETFTLEREEVDMEKTQFSVQTKDGSQWAIFHESINLYHIENGNVSSRIDLSVYSSLLQVLDDGYVYNGSGRRLQRVENGALVDVLATYAPLDGNFTGEPVHLASAEDGSLWVAANYKLWHLDKEESTIYDINARKVLVASDGSVWAVAWDGKSETVESCCFMHIDGEVIQRYWFDGELPVNSAIEAEIRTMRADG